MCGRYVRKSDKQKLAEHFRAQPNPAELPMPDADYNVAPTTHQPIIRQSRETGDRELILARWGLVPFFTTDLNDIKGLDHQRALRDDHQSSNLAGAIQETSLPRASFGILRVAEGRQAAQAALRL